MSGARVVAAWRREAALLRLRARKLGRVSRQARYRRALRRGVLAATDHMDAGLGPDFGTVIDVGASRGQFALFARQSWPRARLICFEPLTEAAERIREVVDGPLTVHCAAVGARAGELTLNVAARDDSSSLLPIDRQAREFPGTAAAGTRAVPVDVLSRHLDASVPGPVLLKIDVQGFELEVLRGAGDALDRVDEILCECSFVELYTGQALVGEVVAFLSARGFALAHVSGIVSSVTGRQLQADLTFRRAPSPDTDTAE